MEIIKCRNGITTHNKSFPVIRDYTRSLQKLVPSPGQPKFYLNKVKYKKSKMKKSITCFYFMAALLSINTGQLFAQTKIDTLLVKETVLNYLEGLETNNPARVEMAMHPDLAKRTIEKNKEGKDFLSNMTAASLVGYTKDFDFTQFYKKGVDPKEPLKVETIIYDISDSIATVKATQNKFEFFDYIHLGKINGEWKIINILWAWTGSTNKWMNKQKGN